MGLCRGLNKNSVYSLHMTEIISPEAYYGFKPGTDRKLVRWDKVVEYFWKLDESSDRIKVVEEGKSTMGYPILVAYISSPENLKNLDEIKKDTWGISHPEDLDESEVDRIISEGKTVVAMTMSIHASEVGGTQVASDFAYQLLTSEEALIQRIRENVVLIFFPCANPDGQIMTVDWYNEYLGTEFEGGSMPWLYHKYVGHDNNRDALTLTQVETQIMNRVILKEWFPQAFIDHHQMGFYGSRFFVPPNSNPVNEVADPLVWTEQKHYGAQIAIRMASEGISGVEQAAVFPSDFMPGFSLVFPWFNICGMFTESASVKVASPVYVHYHQLQPHPRGRPEYRASVNFNDPWKGGWWHLSDIVRGQLTAALATLEVAANNPEMILKNMHTKALRSISKGKEEAPYAFIFPPGQVDPNTTYRFLKTLSDMTVEIYRAEKPFKVGEVTYPADSYIVFADQVSRPFLIMMLSRTYYRDNLWVRTPEGVPMMNYDFATQTMGEFKGVEIIEADHVPVGSFKKVEPVAPKGELLGESKHGYLIDCRINDSFKAVNKLHKMGFEVKRFTESVKVGETIYPAGMFHVAGDEKKLQKVAKETHLKLIAVDKALKAESKVVKPLRIAMYQRYWGGNMDEGWTRWLLEQFDFECSTVMDEQVKAGLGEYDVLILPSDSTALITGEKVEEFYDKKYKGAFTAPVLPEKYKSGIGDEGVKKVIEFVENGGTVIALNDSCEFAMEKLGVQVINTLKEMDPKKFHCPGSTIWVNIDNKHSLGYGMPEKGLILLRGNHAYIVKAVHSNEDYSVVVSYPEENMMQSGWLIGEEYLARKAAVIEAKRKAGKVIMYGFAPQNRALTDATFKLFFNALVG
jgi:hypothetical protein